MTDGTVSDAMEGDLIDAFFAEISSTQQPSADSAQSDSTTSLSLDSNAQSEDGSHLKGSSPINDQKTSEKAQVSTSRTSPESDSNSRDDLNFFSNASVRKKLETPVETSETPVEISETPLPKDSTEMERTDPMENSEKPPEVETSPASPDEPMQPINGMAAVYTPSSPMHEFSIEDLLTQDMISHPDETIPASSKVEEHTTDYAGIFKRPLSPGQTPQSPQPTEAADRDETERMDESSNASKIPQEVPSQRPVQKCFLTIQKKRRPETETSHIMSIIRSLQHPEKLGLPDNVLTHYLSQTGMEVHDVKVARILGAAAEHHTACIVQDAFEIFINNNQQDKKRGKEGKEKETGSGKPDKDKPTKVPKRIGRPPSSGSGKSLEKKKNSSKLQGKTKKKKKDTSDGDTNSDSASMDVDGGNVNYDSETPARNTIEILPLSEKGGSSVEILPFTSAQSEAMDIDMDSAVLSKEIRIISSNVHKDDRSTRKERKEKVEKEVEKKNVLTLEMLAPVLKEHGYQLANPPYFVN